MSQMDKRSLEWMCWVQKELAKAELLGTDAPPLKTLHGIADKIFEYPKEIKVVVAPEAKAPSPPPASNPMPYPVDISIRSGICGGPNEAVRFMAPLRHRFVRIGECVNGAFYLKSNFVHGSTGGQFLESGVCALPSEESEWTTTSFMGVAGTNHVPMWVRIKDSEVFNDGATCLIDGWPDEEIERFIGDRIDSSLRTEMRAILNGLKEALPSGFWRFLKTSEYYPQDEGAREIWNKMRLPSTAREGSWGTANLIGLAKREILGCALYMLPIIRCNADDDTFKPFKEGGVQ